jgi:Cu/Ag efflux protein CusF
MALYSLRALMLGLAPIVLNACVEIEPATGSPTPTAPLVGVDLGSSGRVPQIAGLAGEGEGYGRTEPNPSPTGHESMPGIGHGSMDHGSMPGMTHGSMDHRSMPRMRRGSTDRASGNAHGSMDHGSMPGMRHGPRDKMASAQASPGKKDRSGGGGTQMAHSGHAHVQGTGTVNSVDAANRKVNVTHGPIPTIGWPSMTMDFAVAPAVDLNTVKPGIRIKFDMEQGQGGMYVIQSITPAGGGR